jgi:AbrB family looped-hinge helix DNA binding protein
MKTQLSSKGQIVLPAELREEDQLVPGQVFEIRRLASGEYLLKKSISPGQPGLLKLLRSCPSQDWFVPIDSESTDSLQ